MLGKLIGYETKAFGRIMLPLYGAMLAYALFTGLSIRFAPNHALEGLPAVLIFMLYTFLMLAIIIMTCVLSVTRFYKNLLGQEGYLMFSLPTDTATLIASKVISVVIWSTLSSVVSMLAIALSVLGGGGLAPFKDIVEFFSYPEAWEQLPSVLGILILTALIVIVSTAASIVRIYAGIAIGHQFNDHRILFSILALVAFSVIGTTLSSLLGTLGYYSGALDSISRIFDADSLQGLYLAQGGMIALSVAQLAFFGVMTWWLLDHKLNLE